MGIQSAFANNFLNAALRQQEVTWPVTVYFGLHDGDPGTTGANEITGGGYERAAVTFGAPVDGSSVSSNDIEFEDLPGVTLTFVSLWDDNVGSVPLWTSPITSRVILAGSTLQVSRNSIVVSVE